VQVSAPGQASTLPIGLRRRSADWGEDRLLIRRLGWTKNAVMHNGHCCAAAEIVMLSNISAHDCLHYLQPSRLQFHYRVAFI
jgi:hypothetical protein